MPMDHVQPAAIDLASEPLLLCQASSDLGALERGRPNTHHTVAHAPPGLTP